MIEADSGDGVDPMAQKGFVFGATKLGIESTTDGEDKVVHDGVIVIAKIETSGGGLGGMVIGEEVGVETHVDFIEENVIGAGLDDLGEEDLALVGLENVDGDGKAESGEAVGDALCEVGKVTGVDSGDGELRGGIIIRDIEFAGGLSETGTFGGD